MRASYNLTNSIGGAITPKTKMSATTKSETTKSATTKYRRTGPHQAGAYSAVGEQVLRVVIGAPSGACYEVLNKLAFACRACRGYVHGARKLASRRLIQELTKAPDFEAGYAPELIRLRPLISPAEYTDLKDLLLSGRGEDFYVWALLSLELLERTCTLAPLTPIKFDFADALFPLIGDDDWAEAEAMIEFFLEETGILRHATAEERESMEWVLRPASFAARYNDTRGTVPPFVRLLGALVGDS